MVINYKKIISNMNDLVFILFFKSLVFVKCYCSFGYFEMVLLSYFCFVIFILFLYK